MQIETIVTQYQTNTYIIMGEKTVVVDPGGSTEEILNFLDEVGRTPDFVIVTHGHYDHTFSCGALAEKGAKIFMSKKDDYLVAGGGHLKSMGIHVAPFAYEDISDGQFLRFGDLSFTVMTTPGHTPGGVCYVMNECVFSGDTLFRHTIGRTDFPGSDMGEMRLSLKRLLSIEKDLVVFPGHGPSTTLLAEEITLKRFSSGV